MIEIILLSVVAVGVLALHGHILWVKKELKSHLDSLETEIKEHVSSLISDFDDERTKLVADKAAFQLQVGKSVAVWNHDIRKVVR